jgi:hypothetical protein
MNDGYEDIYLKNTDVRQGICAMKTGHNALGVTKCYSIHCANTAVAESITVIATYLHA